MGKGSGGCEDRPALSIYGVSDLHLGPGGGKGHFSSTWIDHQSRLRKAWDKRIGEDDLVLLPGDFSWHRDPADLRYDYLWLDERPGRTKVLSPGNHDYGIWDSEEEANGFLEQFKTQTAVMDNAIRIQNPLAPDGPGLVVAAAQGSQSPGDKYFNTNAGASSHGKENESVRFLGELVALDQALRHAADLRVDGDALVVMIHYPPFKDGAEETVFSRMIERAGADLCVYGHLHREEQFRKTVQGPRNGVDYRFLGADFLRFTPTKLAEWTEAGFEPAPIEVVGRDAWPEPKKYTHWTTTSKSSTTKKSKPSDAKSDTKPFARKQVTNSSGAKLVCKECDGGPIYNDESYHFTPNGPIHDSGGGVGKVTYGATGTCPHAKAKAEGSAPKSTASAGSTPPVAGGARSGGRQRKRWAESRPAAKCLDCGGAMRAGETYHDVPDGFVHGPGAFGQFNTCHHRTKNNQASKNTGASDKAPKPHGVCAVCDENIGGLPHKQWLSTKDGTLVCKECFGQMDETVTASHES